jgi:DNA polymerase III delta prime subunit
MTEKFLWYHKYRPDTLDGYVWKSDGLRKRVQNWIENPEYLPNIIFHGHPGTGKTTLAKLIPLVLEIDDEDVLFINTTRKEHSGIDAIRGLITNFCESSGWGGLKIVIIDEADRLTKDAQDGLRGVIDGYDSHVRFLFTCNYFRRMSDAVKSRSTAIEIDAMDQATVCQRLLEIGEAEKVLDSSNDSDLQSVLHIVEETYPDVRKATNILQEVFQSGVSPEEALAYSRAATWEESVLESILGGSQPNEIKELSASIRQNEIEDVYRFLYSSSGILFQDPNVERFAIRRIADYMFKNSFAGFPDILLSGLLIELSELAAEKTDV